MSINVEYKINTITPTSLLLSTKKTVDLTIDSAASDNYVRPKDAHLLSNVCRYNGIPVTLPDVSKISTCH